MARNLMGFRANRAIGRQFVEALDTAVPLLESALVLEREIKAQLSRPGSAKPSAPGKAPAMQTGKLHRSIGHRLMKRRRLRSREKIRIGTGEPYAPALEFGRKRKGPPLMPRPFMRPALEAAKGRMFASFRAELKAKGIAQRRRASERRAAHRAADAAAE